MGILNVTPDSFSDGGQFTTIETAVARAQAMVAEGADWVDIGGESTRPGAERVPAQEQIRRVIPVLRGLRGRIGCLLSIDTSLAAVAEAAIDEGAHVVNDVSAGRDDPALFPLVARRKVSIVLMHMPEQPATMQIAPYYRNVTKDVLDFLSERVKVAAKSGIDGSRILIDPGIGFGKTTAHDLELLRNLAQFRSLGRPTVLGTSRKKFVAAVTGAQDRERVFGTAATISWGIANGADVVRVHDVAAMSQVVRMARAIQNGER